MPLHPVRLDHDREKDHDADGSGQDRQVAHPGARRDQHRRRREAGDHRGPEVRLEHDQPGDHGHGEQERAHVPDRAGHLRARGEQLRAVEDQGHLGDLGRLNLEEASADPPLGAVHFDPDARDHHGDQQEERERHQGHRQRPQDLDPARSQELERQQADDPIERSALEVVGAVARLAQERGRGARGEDHDHAQRDQAERRREEHRVLDRHGLRLRRRLRRRLALGGRLAGCRAHRLASITFTSSRKWSPRAS